MRSRRALVAGVLMALILAGPQVARADLKERVEALEATVATLQGQLGGQSAVVTALQAQLAALQGQVATLENTVVFSGFLDLAEHWNGGENSFPGTVVTTLSIPPGHYFIIGKVNVAHTGQRPHEAGCRLLAGNDTDRADLLIDTPGSPLGPIVGAPITLSLVHTTLTGGVVVLQCYTRSDAYFMQLNDIKITAIKVGGISSEQLLEP